MRVLPKRITTRLILVSLLVVVAALGSYGGMLSWRQGEVQEEIFQRERLVITRDLANSAVHFLVVGDYANLDVLMRQAADLPDVVRAQACETDGRVVSDFSRSPGGSPVSRFAQQVLPVPPGQEPRVIRGPGVMTIWQPVVAGVQLGWVRVEYSLDEIARLRQLVWVHALLMAGIWGGVSLFLLYLLFHKPLAELRRITGFAGKLPERIGEELQVNSGSLEIEALGASLNFASREIRRNREDLLVEREQLRVKEERFEALFTLSQMHEAREEAVARFALEECVRFTGSRVGYLHFVHEDQKSINLFLWSEGAMQECTAAKVPHYPLDQAGVWADCVRQRAPVIHNDYPSLPGKKGYPAGHFPVLRHLSIPVMDGERVVAVVGVGNKEAPYDDADVRQMSLFMNDMWGILSRRRQATMLRSILDSLGEGLIVVNREYTIISANQVYADSVGIPLAALIGRPCHEVSHHLDKPCFLAANGCDCAVATVFATGAPAAATHQHETVDGEMAWMDTRAFPLRNEAGEVAAVIEVVADVTERRRLEGQLRQSQKMEAIGTLAGGIAHDFNNILSALLGYAELAKLDTPADHPVAGYVAQIQQAGDRAKELVRQILTFSRKGEQELKPLAVHLVVKEALKLIRASIPANVEIRQEIAPDCGQVLADPAQMHQVVMNLCTNAFHAMQGRSGVITVRMANVDLAADDVAHYADLGPGQYLYLEVSDNGCGIDHAIIDRIFDPYFTTKEKGKGTGLGLSMVLGIVRGHGGHISVYSEPGVGTAVKIYLPRLNGDRQEESVRDEVDLPRGSERVLLVDDEEAIIKTTGGMLERLGYRVMACVEGQEALSYLKGHLAEVDLILTDVAMPKMTGIELAEAVRRLRPNLPLVLCSGYSDAISPERMRELAASFLLKPIAFRDLALGVRRALDVDRVA